MDELWISDHWLLNSDAMYGSSRMLQIEQIRAIWHYHEKYPDK
jgi:hypothetical protein